MSWARAGMSTKSARSSTRLLSRYLFRLWAGYSVSVTAIFVLVLMVLYGAEVLEDIAGGHVPISMLGWQVLLYLPEAIRTVAPLGVMLGVMLAMGQLHNDGELTMLTAVGMTPRAKLRTGLFFGICAAAIILVLSGWLLPAAKRFEQTLFQQAARSAEFWGLQPGQFTELPEDKGVIYVAELDRQGVASEVFVNWRQADQEQVLTSSNGQFRLESDSGERSVTMQQGRRTAVADNGSMQMLDFSRAQVRLPAPASARRTEQPSAWRWPRLLSNGSLPARAEIHWRVAHALACVILTGIALMLVRYEPRRQTAGRLLLALLIYVLYINLLNLSQVWVSNGRLSPVIGLWWVHAVALLIALGLSRLRRRLA